MIVKQHLDPSRRLILAICDDELIGQVIKEKNMQLDLSADFYKGEKLDEKEVEQLSRKAYVINAAGKRAVACCIKAGICDEESVLRVGKVPYLQIVRF